MIPTPDNEFVLLDSGANIESKPMHLAHYAIMGSIYSREILGYKNPRVGVLSIGTEENKGNDLTLEAFKLCKKLDINFIGNVEGHDLFKSRVEVVVCDGFVGNIVLKTCESLAVGIFTMLKRELKANLGRKLGALLAQNAFRTIKKRMDPEAYGGAPLLGFNGAVMKAHGSARERAIASAIRVATETLQHRINQITAKFKNPRAKYNFQGRTCSITGVGSYVPARILTNAELEKIVDTSDEWITSRTGIKERRLAAIDEFTSDLAAQAARKAMQMAGVTAEQIDLIIIATITPDMPFPSTACLVQQKIGARRAAAFDVEAACSGFIYGLEIAQQFIMSRTYDTVLVVGAEKLSSIVDWEDRNTCVLFGDGAGASILQNRPNAHGLLTAVMGADGEKSGLLFTAQSVTSRMNYLRMEGKETFKNAVQAMQTAAEEAMHRCEIDITKIKCVVPHQANRRIIDAVGERLGARPDQLFINVDRYGNTSAASVAIALDEAISSGRVQRGDLILLVVFGAGLTWGAAVIEW